MKKNLLSRFFAPLVAIGALTAANTQGQVLLEENFTFTGPLSSNGWTAISAAGTNAITAAAPGLTYPNLPSSGIGNAASVHFALAMPSVTMASVIPVNAPQGRHPYRVAGNYFEDDIIVEPFAVRDGALLAPAGPGLGIEIDEAKLERYRVR